jgi:galactokinase
VNIQTITFGTYAICRKREDKVIRVYSMNFESQGIIEFSLDDLKYSKEHNWANYPKGMILYTKEKGYTIENGVDILFYGNIPNGAGLSSSASVELVTGVLLEKLYSLEIEKIELVKIGKQVENEFIGVNSGIMDQFAIGMGKKDLGILLNCQTLKYEYAPVKLDKHCIIIMNTNKRRELADSKYNERNSECQKALAELKTELTIEALADLTEEQFQQNKHLIKSEVRQRRAKHAVYENQRTLKAFKFLKQGDINKFGLLVNDSHISLRDDYEVTGIELDTLVAKAWNEKGVIGARMTGAGFGGCAIAIVENIYSDSFIENIGKEYKEEIGYEAEFYVANVGDGAKEIKLEGTK